MDEMADSICRTGVRLPRFSAPILPMGCNTPGFSLRGDRRSTMVRGGGTAMAAMPLRECAGRPGMFMRRGHASCQARSSSMSRTEAL